jgi:hypothetical protein
MLTDFVNQANSVYARLMAQPAPRYVPILLGTDDVCGGTVFKYNLSCPRGSDQDRNNYCRTTAAAFEREVRKGLDILMAIPDTHIGIGSMVRVSQLCNHSGKTNCQTFTSCRDLWRTAAYFGWVFGQSSGLCASLTSSCADTRIADAYRMAKTYRDVLVRVASEYASIAPGEQSQVVLVGGETVGGGFKSESVSIAYSDAPWRYRIRSADVSCCDCFHPSGAGQNAASEMLFDGLTCTPERPCCADTADPVASGRCTVTITDGSYVPGLFASERN